MILDILLTILGIIVVASIIGWAVERMGLGAVDLMRGEDQHEAYCNDCEYYDVPPDDLPCRECMQGKGANDRFRLRKDN